jgi:hypothetical protein
MGLIDPASPTIYAEGEPHGSTDHCNRKDPVGGCVATLVEALPANQEKRFVSEENEQKHAQ